MKLYIIGNGFDLAHGLPTSYWSFREYLEEVDAGFLSAFEEHYYIYPGMTEKAKKELLWNKLETNLANIEEDIIIEDATSIEMYLESGDVGIEDTLYDYFSEEYQYIEKLAIYLKHWVESIQLGGTVPRVSAIDKSNQDIFVNFNYTATLEDVYGIYESSIIHIHGSLGEYTDDPILGHGNLKRIEAIEKKQQAAEEDYDEKEISICRVIKDYYKRTMKDVNKYMGQLHSLQSEPISKIVVAGHSLSGIDMPYFEYIDFLTNKELNWTVIWYDDKTPEAIVKRDSMKRNLIDVGINEGRIHMIPSWRFYDLEGNDEAAKCKLLKTKNKL